MANLKKLPAVFYATPSGKESVREWLKKLDSESRRRVGEDIATAEFGWPVGMPLCRDMGKGLYEIRSNVTDGRIARVLFAVIDGEIRTGSFARGSQTRRASRFRDDVRNSQ